MIKPIWSVCLIATAIVLGTVCIASAQTTADEQVVLNFYKDWSAATMKEGPEGYARFFPADGVLLPPDSPRSAVGRQSAIGCSARSRSQNTSPDPRG